MEHYICSASGEIDLTQEGEVEGFRAGDQIVYSGECYPRVFGKHATVIGFSTDRKIWTMPDGQTGCHWTPAEFARRDLHKLS